MVFCELTMIAIQDGKTTETLFRYIQHRAFGKAFTQPASISDRDYVFVPTGPRSYIGSVLTDDLTNRVG